MNHLIFTVYDEKAEVYLPPFFVPTLGIATRAFKDCINSPEHQFGKHPHDYTLFHLGEYDDSNSKFGVSKRKMLGNGVEFLDPEHLTALQEFNNGQNRPPILTNETSGDPP